MIKMLGAALLLAGSAGFGLVLAAAHHREMRMLRCLMHGIQEMAWELKFRMTALPELCRIGAEAARGPIREVLAELSDRLSRNEVEDISGSMNQILTCHDLPGRVRRNLRQLGASLGRFDLEGQLQGLEVVKQQCRLDLKQLQDSGPQRIRNYQTIALCTAAALAILFI